MEHLRQQVEPFTNKFPLHFRENEYYKRFWMLESIKKKDLQYLQVLLPIFDNYVLFNEARAICSLEWAEGFEYLLSLRGFHHWGAIFDFIINQKSTINLEVLKFIDRAYPTQLWTWRIQRIKRRACELSLPDIWSWIVNEKGWTIFDPIQPYLHMVLSSYMGKKQEILLLEAMIKAPNKLLRWNHYSKKHPVWLRNSFYTPLRYTWMRRVSFEKKKGSHGLRQEVYENILKKCVKMVLNLKVFLKPLPLSLERHVLQYCACDELVYGFNSLDSRG